jgi:hypothetical protein
VDLDVRSVSHRGEIHANPTGWQVIAAAFRPVIGSLG